MAQQQLAVALHQRAARNVFHHHRCFAKCSRAASANAFGDGQAFKRQGIAVGQTGGGTVKQLPALDQQNGAPALRGFLFYQPHHRVKQLPQGRASGDQLQHLFLRQRKTFPGLAFSDIRKYHQGTDQRLVRCMQGSGAHAQNPVLKAGSGKQQIPVVDAGTAQGLLHRSTGQDAGRCLQRAQGIAALPFFEQHASLGRGKNSARRGIEQQKSALGVYGDHALTHAIENQVEHRALGVSLPQSGVERTALGLQRFGHAVERLPQLADFVMARSAKLNARQKIAARDLVGFFEQGVGGVHHQALAHRPGTGHAKHRHEQQSGQISQQQGARCGREEVARHAEGHEQPATGAADRCIRIHLLDALAVERLAHSPLP